MQASVKIQFQGAKKPIDLSEIKFKSGKGNSVGISDETGPRGILPGNIGVVRQGQQLSFGVLNEGRFESLDKILDRLNSGN